MRRKCSWCGEILNLGSTLPLQTTHGVCNPCARELLASIAGSTSKGIVRRETKIREDAILRAAKRSASLRERL